MKTILIAGACLLSSIGGTFAQQKLWSWKPKNSDLRHYVHSVAMHKDGSAAFVLSEFKGNESEVTFQIIWINAAGKQLMNQKIQGSGQTGLDVVSGFGAQFSVSFLGDGKLAVVEDMVAGGSAFIRIYKSENGTSPQMVRLKYSDTMIFPASGFPGWLEKEEEAARYKMWDGQTQYYQDLKSLTAWKL